MIEFEGSDCGTCNLCREAAYEELKTLESDDWIDKRTRAVIVEFTLFHTQSTLFSSIKLVLEISPVGRVKTSLQVVSVFLYKYTSTMDYVVLVSEVRGLLCILFCLHNVFLCFILITAARAFLSGQYLLPTFFYSPLTLKPNTRCRHDSTVEASAV